jgi:hypothetical protein
MLPSDRRTKRLENFWCKQNIIVWAFAWTALSLFVYMFFSGAPQNTERPIWYRFLTVYVLQNVPLVVAGILCIRNGLSNRMPSGSKVWLWMGIALISFLIGNIFFGSWELVWNLNSTGSLGDPFFCIFYVFLSLAMLSAIASKQIRLKMYQWAIVAGVTIYAATLVMWILKPPAVSLTSTGAEAAIASQSQSATNTVGMTTSPSSSAPDLSKSPEPESTAPEWVMFFDNILKPYGQTLNSFYVWSDVVLFALAIVMILAFWGGRLSNAWQVNAQAIICFYIADMWYAYAGNQIKDYQGGFMLEVFWILGAVQFAVAAAVEFEHMLERQKKNTERSEYNW